MHIYNMERLNIAIFDADYVFIKPQHPGIFNPDYVRISKKEAYNIVSKINKEYQGPLAFYDGSVLKIG